MAKDLHDFIEKCQTEYNKFAYKITIDSAEGALKNQYYKDYGVAFHPVAKAKKVDMIDYVQNLLAQVGFFIWIQKPTKYLLKSTGIIGGMKIHCSLTTQKLSKLMIIHVTSFNTL